ncbi:VOC family protein [Pseudonocardia sp. MH-G8]|uniref:VOC family protein n=1 Tax=Pseudonocardia sp. MH-G8 TaxID=1854588 RepID=UPI000BA04DCB|nr:VOC family protein [Pseudonocardia sp. MH-G8]OZM80451.1 glyoxalase-like domain protein [Pseudonocardia sp. MH-G8]
MRLENIVWDARDPRSLGRFWAGALDARPITDENDGFEARLTLSGDAFLDLCFQRVADPSSSPARLHPDLRGGADQREVVERLLGLGAAYADVGQGDVPWVVLADLEGNAFCVMEEREVYRDTGPIAALPLDSADPGRDARFWAEITGWVPGRGMPGAATLRHPSGAGPLLELCPEPEPKLGKNGLHLDVRREAGEGDPTERLVALGARRISEPGEYPWLQFVDPSGNEFCVLPAP